MAKQHLEVKAQSAPILLTTTKESRSGSIATTAGVINKMASAPEMSFVLEYAALEKSYDDQETMLKFIESLRKQSKLIDAVNFIIRDELKGNKLAILREECLGSCLLKHYWFHLEGKEYLKKIIKPFVKEIGKNSKTKALEVDPQKTDEASAKKNLVKMLSILNTFLNSFFKSFDQFPKPFEEVLSTLYSLLTETEGAKKSHLGLGYSEDALRLFGGFLLLRFICPAIVSPIKYGLVKNVTPTTQRTLVIASKVLQSIANQIEFDEPHMSPANELIQNSMPGMLAFLNNLMTRLDKSQDEF